jgi:hypothetical protein
MHIVLQSLELPLTATINKMTSTTSMTKKNTIPQTQTIPPAKNQQQTVFNEENLDNKSHLFWELYYIHELWPSAPDTRIRMSNALSAFRDAKKNFQVFREYS